MPIYSTFQPIDGCYNEEIRNKDYIHIITKHNVQKKVTGYLPINPGALWKVNAWGENPPANLWDKHACIKMPRKK